jgi:hypothetical protein
MTRFFLRSTPATIESIQALLGKRGHWKRKRSAFERAHSWLDANGIPDSVRRVLDTCPDYSAAVLIKGTFEHQTKLRSAGRCSETDLLLVLRLANRGTSVIAVEGKAGEKFGPAIRKWLYNPRNAGEGRERRLKGLCGYFGLTPESTFDLRYQLLHRTAAACFEAQNFGAKHAMVLIHSFAESTKDFSDYLAFIRKLGIVPSVSENEVSNARDFHGVQLRFAWVGDQPTTHGEQV